MNLNNSVLMRAVLIGAGIGLATGVLQIGSFFIPLIGIACICVNWIANLAAGAVYGYFAEQEGGTPDVAEYAAGGAAGGAAAALVGGIMSSIGTALSVALGVSAQAAAFEDLGIAGEQMAAAAAGGIVGAVVAVCVGIFLFAALGAGVGAIYATIRSNQGGGAAPAL
ncbi:MAG: hypothetical protein GYB68_17345 [Chloroflexi bacterium]|nr:hypothetical protein [Chloroflexota bacterium]